MVPVPWPCEVTPMLNQPLFFAPPGHDKVAGYKLPANPRFWQSEIIRYLKSMHPYLPMDESEIDLRRMDVNKGSAVGSVILSKEIAIPIIINRPRPGAEPELAPLDVFFHQGRYQFLDPEAIKQMAHKPQIGEPEGRKSQSRGGNPYIGDVTGDATPLEYSGQASPFAGPYDGVKMSMDVSVELLPEWMLKEADAKLREEMKDKATSFGITGTVGGGIRSGIQGAKKGGTLKRRLLNAAIEGGKGAAFFGTTGAIAGGTLPVAKRGLGLDKKEKREQVKAIRDVVRSEVEKKAEDFTVGLDTVVEHGLTSRLLKTAYLDPNAISNFRHLLATNPHILQGSGNNLKLVEIVARRGPEAVPIRSQVRGPNILQVYRKPDGNVCIKFSGGPETKTTPEELKKALGDRFPEVMSKLRSGDVYMQHDGVQQASWNAERPMGEAKPVMGDGLFAVRDKNGDSVVGMVVTSIMDFDGKSLPLKMFVTPEGKYAIVGEMFGVKLADKHRLPSQTPSGGQSGVFVNYVHGTPIATLPMRLISVRRVKPEGGDERILYMVQNPMTGERIVLSPVQSVQGFERMHVVDPGVKALSDGAPIYYMPGDSEWVTLRTPLRLAESEAELTKVSSAPATHVTYGAGMWHIDACVEGEALVDGLKTAGVKESSWHDLDEPSAREMLVAMGVASDNVQEVLDQARERPGMDRGVKLSGLHAPQICGFEIIEPVKVAYDEATVSFTQSLRPGAALIKAAAESGHPETLDAILSLEFITPQNLKYFIDNIPDFEEAASRLAALLIAVRLGMPHVPEQPVKDALEGLSKTVNKLRILKSAVDHKNERSANSE